METSLVSKVVTEMTQCIRHDGPFPYLENRVLKRLCFESTVSCSFAVSGCHIAGKGMDVSLHEETCKFSLEDCGKISNKKCSLGHSMEELILAELECPVCYTCIKPPIMECFNGHQLCNECTMQVQTCPICRGRKAVANNSSLEYFYYLVEVPCRNAAYGCDMRGKGIHVIGHEMDCSFFPRSCPLRGNGECRWKGSITQMVNHCKTEHSDTLFMEPEHQWDLHDFFMNMYSYKLFYIHGVLFRCIWSVREDNVRFSVNYIDEKRSNRFKYEIIIYISDTDQKLASSEGECARINYGNFQCICNDSVLVPVDHLFNYIGENLDVRFAVRIFDNNLENSKI